MSSARTTHLLAALLIVAALCCAAAFARLNRASRAADDAARAFAQSQSQLMQLSTRAIVVAGGGSSSGAGDTAGANTQINRHLRDAATATGVAEKLVSIEPGEPNQVPGTDYQEMLVFLRLESIPLRQLVAFLHEHAVAEAASHAKTIELSARRAQGADDTWLADVTLAYTSYAPQQQQPETVPK
jgi:hypothetical protein